MQNSNFTDIPPVKTIDWCGYRWVSAMEGNRPVHPERPWYYMDGKRVFKFNNEIHLSIAHDPAKFIWYKSNWKDQALYEPNIACGVIRSATTFTVDTSFECEVKMPIGKNLWFSFWLTACDDWPPEIDIFEGYTDKYADYFDKIGLHWKFPFVYRNMRFESNIHYKNKHQEHRHIGAKGVHEKYIKHKPQSQWNRFRCDWRNNAITFYINEKLVRTITNKRVLSAMQTQGMWAIFNIWPNDQFDVSKDGDIKSFVQPFIIRNFKTRKI